MNFPPPEFSSPHPFPPHTFPAARPELYACLDVAVLVTAMLLCAWLSLRRRSRAGIFAVSLGTLAYLGFWRLGCVCPIGAIQNVTQAACDPGYALTLTAALFFLLPLAFALFFGRVFCAGVCPLGGLQDLVLVEPVRLPSWLHACLGLLPFVYLGAAVLYASLGSVYVICRYDPFVGFFRMSGPSHMLIAGAVFLVLGTFIGRPYCRSLCPYGALLRIVQLFSWRRASISPEGCVSCSLCQRECPFNAIRPPRAAPEGEVRERGRRLMGRLVLGLPLFLLLGAAAGYLAAPALAALDPEINLAKAVSCGDRKDAPGADLVAAEAFQRQGGDAAKLMAAAEGRMTRFRSGSLLLGLWLGFMAWVLLIRHFRQTPRRVCETDPMECLSCGRCFAACPQEQERLRLARGGIAGASPPELAKETSPWLVAARRTAVVAALFSGVVLALLLADLRLASRSNPLSRPDLPLWETALAKAEQAQDKTETNLLVAHLRRLDEWLRSRYFQSRQAVDHERWLLLAGLLVFAMSSKLAWRLGRPRPAPEKNNKAGP